MLPKDFLPRQMIYWWSCHFVRLMLFWKMRNIALMVDRERAGRESRTSTSAGEIDSQTM